MVSVEDSYSNSGRLTPPYYTPPSRVQRPLGCSMRTIRSNIFQSNQTCSFNASVTENYLSLSENLTDYVVDLRLGELAGRNNKSVKSTSSEDDFLQLSQAFSNFSTCSSDISGELQRLACVPNSENDNDADNTTNSEIEPKPCQGFLQRETFSTEIIKSISPEDLQPTVKICVDGLQSSSVAVPAAAKLRLLAENWLDNRALIGESSAVPTLIPLPALLCSIFFFPTLYLW